jgi:hypothetical protein
VSDSYVLVNTGRVVTGRDTRKRAAVLARFRPYGPLLLILFAASCLDYRESQTPHLMPGREVRITLTPEARTTLASQVGTQVKSVTGRLRSVDSTGVTLAMSRTMLIDGTEAEWNGEVVSVPNSAMAVVEQRKFASGKTIALVALITGLSAAVVVSIGLTTSSNGSGTTSSMSK